MQHERIKLGIQKKGRLNVGSLDLLARCGLEFQVKEGSLIVPAQNMPIDILFLRDDDIPSMIMLDNCDLGIAGENTILEKQSEHEHNNLNSKYNLIMKLGFCECRLSISTSDRCNLNNIRELDGTCLATCHTYLLNKFLKKHDIKANVIEMKGAVEIAIMIGLADAIFDVVSTGRTLKENNLKERITVLNSQAVLIQSQAYITKEKNEIIKIFCERLENVVKN